MATAAILSTLIPALIQAGGSYLANKGTKPASSEQFPTMGPEQQNLQQQIISMLGPLLSGQGGIGSFGEPARKEFFESTVPGLADRFSHLGLQKSSSFNQALGQAGQDLSSRLNQDRMSLLQSLLPSAFGSQFGTGFNPQQPGAFAQGFAPFSQKLGEVGSGGLADLLKILFSSKGQNQPQEITPTTPVV